MVNGHEIVSSSIETDKEAGRSGNRNSMVVIVCKECGAQIQPITSLCGGERKGEKWERCKYDGKDIQDRPAGTVERKTYLLEKVEIL